MPRTPETSPGNPEVKLAKIKANLANIKGRAEAFGDEPDYSAIIYDEAFQNLTTDDQRALAEEFDIPAEAMSFLGVDVKGKEETPAAEAVEPTAPAAPETAPEAIKEIKPERKPVGRKLDHYEFVQDDESGTWKLKEYLLFWNKDKNEYEPGRRPQITDIVIPEELKGAMLERDEIKRGVVYYCEQYRRRLDGPGNAGGLRVMVDRVRGEDGKADSWRPKWRYGAHAIEKGVNEYRTQNKSMSVTDEKWVEGGKVQADSMPKSLLDMAVSFQCLEPARKRGAKPHWECDPWKKWEGRTKQVKRDEIISRGLANITADDIEAFVNLEKGAGWDDRDDHAGLPAAGAPEARTSPEPTAVKAEPAPVAESAAESVATSVESSVESGAKPVPDGKATDRIETKVEKRGGPERVADAFETQRLAEPIVSRVYEIYKGMYETDGGRGALRKEDLKAFVTRVTEATLAFVSEAYEREGRVESAKRAKSGDTEYARAIAHIVLTRLSAESGEKLADHAPAGWRIANGEWRREGVVTPKEFREAMDGLVQEALAESPSEDNFAKRAAVTTDVLTKAMLQLRKTSVMTYDAEAGNITVTDPDGLKEVINARFKKLK